VGGLFGGDTQNINTAATFGDVIISKIAGFSKARGALTITARSSSTAPHPRSM